ncbi:MAG: hypothetical protein ACYC09_00210 [Bacteroidota bacterium]
MNDATIQIYFKYFVATILIFLILDVIYIKFCPLETKHHSNNLLVRDSTQSVPLSKRSARLRLLSDVILQHQTVHSESQLARESERMQARLSFIAAFALLLTTLLKHKESNTRSIVVTIAICLFMGFYYFDIHTVDNGNRENYTKSLLDNTILDLSRIPESDSSIYNIDYKLAIARYDSMAQNPFKRKLASAFYPDVSQMVFYYLPLIVLLGVYLVTGLMPKRNRRLKKDAITAKPH